ncbi:CsgG/HfaB family protein [Glaesserella parasuis]|uniref:CsgG/HfaB family protein n=2 Tax=Glaesserella parasuis TaxID=738 RepID=UPI00385431F5
MSNLKVGALCLTVLTLVGCATENSKVITPTSTQAATTASQYKGVKSVISVGKFDNKSSFQNGVFSDGPDQLGNQSKTILISHLQQTGRFSVVDRTNMSEIASEAKIKGKKQNLKGATYVITGDVTEFGRKTVGDHQLFGILGRGKEQVAYAKVTLNVVNVETSEVVYSSQGAGEYNLSNREVLGFGGTASYDATLNGKVLDLAIREAVNNLVNGIESGSWQDPIPNSV